MSRIQLLFCIFGFIDTIISTVEGRLSGEGIVGGKVASKGQFPYQVSIQTENSHWCGGGLLGERFVLTAAHCVCNNKGVFNTAHYRIVVDTTNVTRFRNDRSVDVDKIYILKSYNPYTMANDVAVLKLNHDIGLGYSVRALELPRSAEIYAGQRAIFAGYGWNWEQWDPKSFQILNGKSDGQLKHLDVNVMDSDKCQQLYKYSIYSSMYIYDTQICGQSVQRSNPKQELAGICRGDSGGPLVVGNTVIGIASRSPHGCVDNEIPSIYCRVSKFVDFIDNVTNGRRTNDMRARNAQGTEE